MSGFWTRRREAVAAEERAEVEAVVAAETAAQEAALEERSDAELLAELGLPEPETLVGGEELQRFLKAQLPQRLKRRALRTLWRSNPVLACLDGLNDYEDDFTDAAVCKGAVNTLYEVGRGFAQQVKEVADKLPEADAASDHEPLDEPLDQPLAEATDAPATIASEDIAPLSEPPTQMAVSAPSPAIEEPVEDAYIHPRLRRMTFQFDQGGTA